ncbi:MAG: peptide deformylase [Gammaproteobacteria bacterium]|tara:strand:- start:56 stop:565 length:510 start_codon:yes stop_codon:yes gene_type:complete
MTIRNILIFPDPKLREVAKEVTKFDEELKKLADDLLETMYKSNGIGLAASQIGIPLRILVLDVSDEKNKPQIFVNPAVKILDEKEKDGFDEGCLSIPSFYEEVIRPVNVEISFYNIQGVQKKILPKGLLGVVVQHEIDHLDGKLMVDYISSTKRQRIRSKLLKLKKMKK